MPGGLDELRVVQRHQRLQRRIGAFAADGAGFAAGRVEDFHRGRRRGCASRTCTCCGDRDSRRVLLVVARVAVGHGHRFPDARRADTA